MGRSKKTSRIRGAGHLSTARVHKIQFYNKYIDTHLKFSTNYRTGFWRRRVQRRFLSLSPRISEGEMEKDSSKSGTGAKSDRRLGPKRGAIPTPKEVLEKAPRYIPENDPASNPPAPLPDSQPQDDAEKDRQDS
jgi:hypothetical protein